MEKLKDSFVVLALLVFGTCFSQQKTDTLVLHEVTINEYRIQKSKDHFSHTQMDSVTRNTFLSSSLAQLLMQQNSSLVKAYGPGNIASLGIRGSTAQQTAVIWNGININNPMLGQTDISLLPAGFFSGMSLQKGALSGYWGSGAMAGVLNLQSGGNQSVKGLSVQASTSYSSLKNTVQWVGVDFSSGKLISSSRLLVDYSQNKYSYYKNTDTSLVKQTQQHAQTSQLGLLQDFSYKLSANQQLDLHIWIQDVNRQIPYTASAIPINASQEDKTLRTMLNWKMNRQKFGLQSKLAFFNEAILYKNISDAVYSNNQFKTFVLDLDAEYKTAKRFTFSAGTSNQLSLAQSPDFISEKQILKNALFENISWKDRSEYVGINAYARQELFNMQTFVPTAGVNTQIRLVKGLFLKVQAGTVYRYPTLNDLYWNPGGNPALKPEQGHSEETALDFKHAFKAFSLSLNGTVFSRDIHNSIMWLPGKEGNWSPVNILQVWSRGVETSSSLQYKHRQIGAGLQILSNYILSSSANTAKGTFLQMPYVPMYSGSAVFTLSLKNWSLRSAYTYTGYRYLSTDNYHYLNPYSIVDLRLAKTFVFKEILLNVFAEVNNLLNENYQSISQYGMPLRNYRIGILFNYQPNKNKT